MGQTEQSQSIAAESGKDADSADGLPSLSYEQARLLAAAQPEARSLLAARADAPPEILYFLREDLDEAVRLAVAANPAAPARANLHLATDASAAVRAAVAAKLASPLPQRVSPRVRALTQEALDHLSRDSLSSVRAALAEGLKNLPDASPAIIGRLARDLEILVAAPILECSPVLGEDDLLDIIRSSPIDGALAAISRRGYVEPKVTEAIVASGEPRAITHLLYNSNAHLQEHTLDALIAAAERRPEWHQPLVSRRELAGQGNEQSLERLATILADHLLQKLVERQDLTPEMAKQIGGIVSQRLRHQQAEAATRRPTVHLGLSATQELEKLVEQARRQAAHGELTETVLIVSLLTDAADEVVAGLSVLSGHGLPVVLDVLTSQVPRAICALCWTAGLSAHFAYEVQCKLGRISQEKAIAQTVNGDYPVPDVELRWQMEMYADG